MNLDYISEQIELRMTEYEGYSDYCDIVMCPKCPYCEKNLDLELWKEIGACYNCSGRGVMDLTNLSLSRTVICNRCGGTGKFLG